MATGLAVQTSGKGTHGVLQNDVRDEEGGKIISIRKIFLNSKNFILEYFFNTIKLFIKPFYTPQNGFGKLLINWRNYMYTNCQPLSVTFS